MIKRNLAVRCIVQKSRPCLSVKVKGQRPRSPGTKRKSAAFCSRVVLWGAVLRQFYAGGKISACSLFILCDFRCMLSLLLSLF